MARQLIISFKGDREQLLNDFKAYCAKNGISMTTKIINLMKTETNQGNETPNIKS